LLLDIELDKNGERSATRLAFLRPHADMDAARSELATFRASVGQIFLHRYLDVSD
jgi:hypothetical protein